MDALRQILDEIAYHRLGIVPITNPVHDVNRILAGVDPAEARKMKRKFRKLWRMVANRTHGLTSHVKISPGDLRRHKRLVGLGKETPTKADKRNRKGMVVTFVRYVEVPRLKRSGDSGQGINT